jgi:hypothetical protein
MDGVTNYFPINYFRVKIFGTPPLTKIFRVNWRARLNCQLRLRGEPLQRSLQRIEAWGQSL